ncbi:JAB domain-containing protein [Virgibacillus oceani]
MVIYVVVANQHPSGDITPSMEDINVARRLVEAGKLLGIEVLDHLVVNNDNSFSSLKERGYIEKGETTPFFFKIYLFFLLLNVSFGSGC